MRLPQLAPESLAVLTHAANESATAGHHYLGVEHLFLGLIEHVESGLATILAGQGVDIRKARAMIYEGSPRDEHRPWGDEMIYSPRCHEVLQLAAKIAARRHRSALEPTHIVEAMFREGRSLPLRILRNSGTDILALHAMTQFDNKPTKTETPLLDRYGNDLTALARAGRLSPVIGRKREQDFLQEVLLRKNKNNPVLVGDAGVGKTAVVESLAQRIVEPDCPKPFQEARLVELSIATLVAGTKFRGEFEERLIGIIEEAKSDSNVILFLDEVHTLVGAGSSGGDSLDASNILKPALARGELRVIGATTVAEYRRSIERDAALDRRFDKVLVDEPSRLETLEILRAVKPSLEEHHQVEIDEPALEAALDLTVRHLPERRLPDKALDALDQSCARCRLRTLRAEATEAPATSEETAPTVATATVSPAEVGRTVSQWTGIPLDRLTGEALSGLLNLESRLRKRVIGQDHAVAAVSKAVLTARAGLAPPNRPVGVFLFLGPTGVGKTELAKSLANQLFGDDKRLIRFDMSEFSEPHSVAKLIGSPPGYVGYEEEGLLISAVRTHPHSVVLFDEIEKAHPQLFDLFLQIFDDGRLSDSRGNSADFRQAVVILTSNLNPQAVLPDAKVGFLTDEPEAPPPPDANEVRRALAGQFRPELVNRVDEILVFNRLAALSLRKIIDRYFSEIAAQLAERESALTVDAEVYDHLTKLGESDVFGARELRRVVDHEIRQPLAEQLLRAGGAGHRIRVGLEDEKLTFAIEE